MAMADQMILSKYVDQIVEKQPRIMLLKFIPVSSIENVDAKNTLRITLGSLGTKINDFLRFEGLIVLITSTCC